MMIKEKTPFYKNGMEYAIEHDELNQYLKSFDENIACARVIEDAINNLYTDNHLKTKDALKEVLKQFSLDRIEYVLANTIQHKVNDGRFRKNNRDWAKSISVYPTVGSDGRDKNCYFVVDRVNTGLVDLFTTNFRKEKERLDRINEKYLVEEMAPDIRWFVSFRERNAKGEKITVEFTVCDDPDISDSLPKQWYKNGYTDHILKTWWNVQTYAEDSEGKCSGKYNPRTKLSEDGKRHVINFDWMLEATEQNAERLFREIYRRAFSEVIGYEGLFLDSPVDSYCIYQVKATDKNAHLLFRDLNSLQELGVHPDYENYDPVYSGELSSKRYARKILGDLYEKFNICHPADYTGRSMSISDIVALKQNNKITCYYVDRIGFAEIKDFIPSKKRRNHK